MTGPEELARARIDRLLEAAGWVLQDRAQLNRNAALGVAVREFQLPSGPCDYLLFIDGKACGRWTPSLEAWIPPLRCVGACRSQATSQTQPEPTRAYE